jgi:hypothetical protein
MDNQAKAKQLIDWFKDKDVQPLKTVRHETFINMNKYIETAINTMNHSELNSTHWKAAYYRLFYLKKQLENN